MEDLDETIIAELKEKAIERPVDATDNILIEEPEPEPEPEPVKDCLLYTSDAADE